MPRGLINIRLGVPGKVSLEEVSIRSGGLSGAEGPPNVVGIAQSTGTQIGQKGGRRSIRSL